MKKEKGGKGNVGFSLMKQLLLAEMSETNAKCCLVQQLYPGYSN